MIAMNLQRMVLYTDSWVWQGHLIIYSCGREMILEELEEELEEKFGEE